MATYYLLRTIDVEHVQFQIHGVSRIIEFQFHSKAMNFNKIHFVQTKCELKCENSTHILKKNSDESEDLTLFKLA